MIERVIIPNRGEIAVRIARACREMKITSILAYSDLDDISYTRRFFDDAVSLGESYLDVAKGTDAVKAIDQLVQDGSQGKKADDVLKAVVGKLNVSKPEEAGPRWRCWREREPSSRLAGSRVPGGPWVRRTTAAGWSPGSRPDPRPQPAVLTESPASA